MALESRGKSCTDVGGFGVVDCEGGRKSSERTQA